jgi:hypothetical protein
MRFGLVSGALTLAIACTPAGLTYRQLAPMKGDRVLTLEDLFRATDTTHRAKPPAGSNLLAVLNTDSAVASVSLYEYDDMFAVQLYVYNNSSRPFGLDPADIYLLDGNRTAFRRLAAHEAANLDAPRVRGIPAYQPKYTYQLNATTYGTVRTYGNTGTYSAQTQGTVTPVEDPYNALGYSIGAAIAASYNRKYQGMAAAVYNFGLGETSSAPPKAGGTGAIYWLKRPNAGRWWQRNGLPRPPDRISFERLQQKLIR